MTADRRLGAYTPETARCILDAVETLERSGMLSRGSRDARPPLPSRDPAFPPPNYRNDSGEQMPAYACMEITGTVRIADRTYFKAVKPTSAVASKPVMFNLHNPVDDAAFEDCGV